MKNVGTVCFLFGSLVAGVVLAEDVELGLGTEVEIQFLDSLNTKDNQPGDTFRAFLKSPITIDGDRLIVPEGSAVRGRIVELRKGKFGGAMRAKRRAKIATTLTAIEVDDEMVSIKSTTNELEMTRSGDLVGRAVAGAAAGALGSSLAGSNQEMQSTAVAVGAVLGMLGGAKQITLPVETEMSFLLVAPLTVSVIVEEEEPPPTIEIYIEGQSTIVSLEQSLTLLRAKIENYSMVESSELVVNELMVNIDALDFRYQQIFQAGDYDAESLEKLKVDIRNLDKRVQRLENPSLLDGLKKNTFFKAISIFGAYVALVSLLVGFYSSGGSLRTSQGRPLWGRIGKLALDTERIFSATPLLWVPFVVIYICGLAVGFYYIEKISWIIGGLVIILVPVLFRKNIFSGLQPLGD